MYVFGQKTCETSRMPQTIQTSCVKCQRDGFQSGRPMFLPHQELSSAAGTERVYSA